MPLTVVYLRLRARRGGAAARFSSRVLDLDRIACVRGMSRGGWGGMDGACACACAPDERFGGGGGVRNYGACGFFGRAISGLRILVKEFVLALMAR